jgi:hypothetical protein
MREMVLITCMGEMKHAYKIVVGNPEILGILRCKWEDNIKICLKEIRLDDSYWIHMFQDRD